MGLDMYLRAEKYVSGYSFHDEENKRVYRGLVDLMGASAAVDPDTPSASVSLTVAYWRKANAIHRWFVENVQGGKDECKPHRVTREQLLALKGACERVLARSPLEPGIVKNGERAGPDTGGEFVPVLEHGRIVVDTAVAEEHLPTTEGFFFGSTDYNEWYVSDLRDTVAQIERVLALGEAWDFEYCSSW